MGNSWLSAGGSSRWRQFWFRIQHKALCKVEHCLQVQHIKSVKVMAPRYSGDIKTPKR
jgi:hypothetical protein